MNRLLYGYRQTGDMEMVKASGLFYSQITRDWTEKHVVEFKDRMEAIRWMNFNRDWAKCLKIED